MLDSVRWFVPDRVVLAEFSGMLTLNDFVEVREQIRQVVSPDHLHSFYVMYDSSARTQLDWRLSDLMQIRDLGYKHPRMRSIVIIDGKPHPLASAVGRMAVHFHGLTLNITRSRDEAVAYLYKIDPTLRAALPR